MALFVAALTLAALLPRPAHAATTTIDSDTLRTGWYPDEASLTPALVSSPDFGQLFKANVTGQVYAQPLVSHGTLFVATEQNNLYGLDPATGAQQWSRQLDTPWDSTGLECKDLNPSVGVTGTPVIDPASNTAYMFSKTYASGSSGPAVWKLHAVDVATGQERTGFPVTIAGHAQNNSAVSFNAETQLERPGLLLMNGVVYGGFAGICDQGSYQGWVVGVSTSGQIRSMWVSESGPSPWAGGIWQAGGGLMSDRSGDIVVVTGNGTSPPKPTPGTSPPGNLAESVIRLRVQPDGSLLPVDFFAPWDAGVLDAYDADLGSGAPVELPSPYFGTPSTPHLIVTGGKQGYLYLLNADNLGGRAEGPNQTDAAVSEVGPYLGYWSHVGVWPGDGGYLYLPTANYENPGTLQVFRYGLDGSGTPTLSLAASSTDAWGLGSGPAVVTSDGTTSGSALVWTVWHPDSSGVGAQLRAYDAVPSGGQPTLRFSAPIGQGPKYQPPGVDGGRVYVGSRDGHVYGFGATSPPALTGSTLSFPETTVGSSNTATETLTATKHVTVTGVKPLGGAFSNAATDPSTPVTLEAGDTIKVSATFQPSSSGLTTGTMTVTTSAGDVPVQLAGNSLDPGAKLSSPASPSFGFGTVATGHQSTAGITFQNSGSSPLTIERVEQPSAPFAVSGAPAAGASIPPGGTVTLNVTFKPTANGSQTDLLALDSTGGRVAVYLSGTGTPPPQFQLSTSSIDFGNVTVGSTASASVVVANGGGSPLQISESRPPLGGPFGTSSLPDGTTIPASGGVTETVRFTPATPGRFSATWEIAGDDGSPPRTITLAGTGVPAPLSLPLLPSPARLASLKISPDHFRTSGHFRGVVVGYKLSSASRVKFTLERSQTVRCPHPRRGQRCARFLPVSSWVRVERGHRGPNSFRFYARLGRRSLPAGLYRLVAAPQNGTPQTVAFRILG